MYRKELQVERWSIERLIPYARNARTHTDEQVAQIAASIAEFGFNQPVLISPDGSIIAGHGRVLAARRLGHSHVPVIVLEHLNENQKRAFMLADNKLALNAGWDEQMLRLELEALAEQDFPMQLTGFPEEELGALLADLADDAVDPDQVPEAKTQVTSQLGDLWELGDHRLLCGDGTDREHLDRVLGGASSDLVFSDLPYNANYSGKTPQRLTIANDNLGQEFGAFLRKACQTLLGVHAGPVYICMSSGELHRLHAAFVEAGGHWSTYVIWAKNTFTLGRSDYQRQYEPILYGWREGNKHFWCGDRNQGDVWNFDKPHCNDVHPTMKPVELIERAVSNSSRRGDVVLDPFVGSGSTVIACERTGRRARVVEIEPGYVDVVVRRWQIYSGGQARLAPEGRSFEEVAQQRLAAGPPEEAEA
jgi:DNA modification methylase